MEDGSYQAERWIRLNDPRDTDEGGVPYGDTCCRPGRAPLRPLDVIAVALQSPCNDLDHPEDWNYDPTRPWQYITSIEPRYLPTFTDTPAKIWHDGGDDRSVAAGFIPRMGSSAASLYLIKAPHGWSVTYWKEDSQYAPWPKTRRRLQFSYADARHDFSITDTAFIRRHMLFDNIEMYHRQTLQIPNPENTFFCLSLTKLSPNFSRAHYKICATIFET